MQRRVKSFPLLPSIWLEVLIDCFPLNASSNGDQRTFIALARHVCTRRHLALRVPVSAAVARTPGGPCYAGVVQPRPQSCPWPTLVLAAAILVCGFCPCRAVSLTFCGHADIVPATLCRSHTLLSPTLCSFYFLRKPGRARFAHQLPHISRSFLLPASRASNCTAPRHRPISVARNAAPTVAGLPSPTSTGKRASRSTRAGSVAPRRSSSSAGAPCCSMAVSPSLDRSARGHRALLLTAREHARGPRVHAGPAVSRRCLPHAPASPAAWSGAAPAPRFRPHRASVPRWPCRRCLRTRPGPPLPRGRFSAVAVQPRPGLTAGRCSLCSVRSLLGKKQGEDGIYPSKRIIRVRFAKYMTLVNSANVLRVYFEKVRGPVRTCAVHLPALGRPVVARLGPSRAWAGLGHSPYASAVTACFA